VIVLIDVRTKIPLPIEVVQIQVHETLFLRALVTQTRANVAGYARLHTVVDKGFLAVTGLWSPDRHGTTFAVPAKDSMAVVDGARSQAAAGEKLTVGHRVHTVRYGQSKTAWAERLEIGVVGIARLTTYDQYGTADHGRQRNRHDFEANPINAVDARKWQNREYGP
jgi:hypothetical protein